jgi:group I intron endonuclease
MHNAQQGHVELYLTVAAEPGIYVLRCAPNGSFYIGSSIDMRSRVYNHISELKRKVHTNKRLQNNFNKYGEHQFSVDVLERCAYRDVLVVEQAWLDIYVSDKRSMNVATIAARPPTFAELPPHIREAKREKHRESGKGRKPSLKLIAVMTNRTGDRNPCFGTSWEDERRKKFSERMTGERNPGYGKRGKESPHYGIKRSEETRQKMSANNHWAKTGNVHPMARRCARNDAHGGRLEFASANKAAREMGVSLSTVCRWIGGKRRPADGSKWEYVD